MAHIDPADEGPLARLLGEVLHILARNGIRPAEGGVPRDLPACGPEQVSALSAAAAAPPQLVTLDQCAALVHVTRRTLYRYRERGLPAPRRPGLRGRASLYDWRDVRPFLEATFALVLPAVHPACRGGR